MDRAKKVLIITNHYLDNKAGGSIATRGVINAFANIFSDCTLIYPDDGIDSDNYISSGVKTFPCSDSRPLWIKGLGIYFGKLHRFGPRSRKHINLNRPDIVVFDSVIISHRLISFVLNLGVFVITVHHNAETDYYRDNKPHILYRLPYLFFLKRTEKRAILKSNLNLTLTESDRTRLLELYNNTFNPCIKTLGVFEPRQYRQFYQGSGLSENKNHELKYVISGNLSFPQSDLSIRIFIKRYWPIIIEKSPGSELIITGKKPSRKLEKLCRNNTKINLIPDPADILGIISDCDIYICPVDRGSGFKFRILDGLKLGLPVISHLISSRGYEHFIDSGFMSTYDSELSFKEAHLRTENQKFSAEKIIEKYHECFSFEDGVKRLKTILEGIEG